MIQLVYYCKLFWKKGLVHIFTGTFFNKLISFLGSIFLVRILSKHDYGILGYLENIYGYIFVLAGMGVSNAILRYVVLGETVQKKCNYFSYAWKRGVLWNICLILLAICFSILYPHPGAYADYVWLLYILFLGLPFQYITDNVLCNERAMFSNQRYAFFSLLLSGIVILTKIIFGNFSGIRGVIICQTLVYIILAIVFFISTKKKYYDKISAETLNLLSKKEINIYSFQYMVTNGLWVVFMLNDTFLLGKFCSPDVIADYRVAYALPGSVTLISSAIGVFVAPYFVKNEANKNWIKTNFKKVYIATAFLVGIICAIISLMVKPIIVFLYGVQYINVTKIMILLLLAAFFNCGLRYTTANILAAMGKIKYNMIISIIGMLLQVAINIKIIPLYGTTGVAITSCIVYAFMSISLLLIFIRQYYWT